MRISDVIESDLRFAQKCGMVSEHELPLFLSGVKDADDNAAVAFLQGEYARAGDIPDPARRDLVKSLSNMYLHLLGKPVTED